MLVRFTGPDRDYRSLPYWQDPMQTPPTITYRNMTPSPAIDDHIHRRMDEIAKAHPRIVGCRVVIDAPQKKHVKGRDFEVRVTFMVPGPDIHVARRVGRSGAAEDVNLAIHEAFDAARRLLQEQKREMGSVEVKQHSPVLHGRVDRLFEGEGYGFVVADDGHEVYFDREGLVSGDWKALKVGTKLRFREMAGDKGPYATNVAIAETPPA